MVRVAIADIREPRALIQRTRLHPIFRSLTALNEALLALPRRNRETVKEYADALTVDVATLYLRMRPTEARDDSIRSCLRSRVEAEGKVGSIRS